jgi:hypothetical protein
MFDKRIFAFVLISFAGYVFAGSYPRPVVMTGVTQMSDTAELRFDPAPANTGTLVILGDHTRTTPQTYRFVYDVPVEKPGAVDPPVDIAFGDKQKLTILCDTLSDNCRSTGYVTEGTSTFSMSWKVTQRPMTTAGPK